MYNSARPNSGSHADTNIQFIQYHMHIFKKYCFKELINIHFDFLLIIMRTYMQTLLTHTTCYSFELIQSIHIDSINQNLLDM